MSGLLCSTLSPENMLNKRRELVADKMNETDDPYERDIYEKLLKRYDNLKRNIPDMENIDMRLASAEF